MAVLRLKVDVDSDVYPELYARLRGIERPQAREERLRQLAAVGLIWEAVRMHGPAATAMPPPEPPLPEPAPRPAAVTSMMPAVPVLVDVVEEAEVSSPTPLDEPPLPPPLETEVQTAAPRSARMKRMVDRGLFRNG